MMTLKPHLNNCLLYTSDAADEQIQTESEEIYIRNGEYSSKIENIRTEITDIESQISEKRSLVSVAENDILHNNENIDRIKNDIAQFLSLIHI